MFARCIDLENWKPIGVHRLESSAVDVVRSRHNTSVVAGPGAGKTELLAQRAAFLLQTGTSPAPQRILAISFKRDAARNLAARVRLRCHRAHASRFDSMTFDAFAKGLLDRFGQALPTGWRPRPDYSIWQPKPRDYSEFLSALQDPPSSVGTHQQIMALEPNTFERDHLTSRPLRDKGVASPFPGEWAAERYWDSTLNLRDETFLTFPMVGRLAELLLRTNPVIIGALRLTYSHLFMDEFQDTTQVQYDLVHTIFHESHAVITAVGDVKQQIMRWANAIDRPFDLFEADFGARRSQLVSNFRSSPELVRIQHVLARALDPSATPAESRTSGTIDGDACKVLRFSMPDIEAEWLAEFVERSISDDNLCPRDFVILVRQKAADYSDRLAPAFDRRGLTLHNEAAPVGNIPLQDLLTEDACQVVILLIRIASCARSAAQWGECVQTLSSLRGIDPNDDLGQRQLTKAIGGFIRQFHVRFPEPSIDRDEAHAVVKAVHDFVGEGDLIASNAAYRQGDWLSMVTAATATHLVDSSTNAGNWCQALDVFEGRHGVSLMTIHKSKGLEYHTVIFVGLDDNAWWSFTIDPVEGKAGFFVAFSRAMQRVLLTYCETDGHRTKVAPLYDMLEAAGVRSAKAG